MRSELDALAVNAEVGPVRQLPGAEVRAGQIGGLELVLALGDIGPVASAVATASVLAEDQSFDAVISTGIAGAFATSGLGIGDLVVATAIEAADFGKEEGDGFVTSAELGWRDGRIECDSDLVDQLCTSLRAARGDVLTVTRLSAEDTRTDQLIQTFPAAVAEAMEGMGVAAAARAYGLPALEVRSISNLVGPVDRYPWDEAAGLDALTAGFDNLGDAVPADTG